MGFLSDGSLDFLPCVIMHQHTITPMEQHYCVELEYGRSLIASAGDQGMRSKITVLSLSGFQLEVTNTCISCNLPMAHSTADIIGSFADMMFTCKVM